MTTESGAQVLFLSGFGTVLFIWGATMEYGNDTVRIKFEGFVLDREKESKESLPYITFAHSGDRLKHGEHWVRSYDKGRKIWAELRDKGWLLVGKEI